MHAPCVWLPIQLPLVVKDQTGEWGGECCVHLSKVNTMPHVYPVLHLTKIQFWDIEELNNRCLHGMVID